MWTILVSLSSECDDTVSAETAPIPLNNDDNYNFWSPAKLSLDGFDLGYNHLEMKFILECNRGRIQVHSLKIPVNTLIYHHQEIPEKKSSLRMRGYLTENLKRISVTNHVLKIAPVELSYVAYQYHDLDDCVTPLGQIHINTLSIQLDLNPFLHNEGHKITCLLNESIYLGRAQDCFTLDKKRFLTWTSSPENDPWMSPRKEGDYNRILEEKRDLDLIRMANPAGFGKPQIITDREHVPDNDAYKNSIAKLPAYYTDSEKPLHMKFFNFKFIPPRCVEYTLKWKHFQQGIPLILSPRTITPRGLFRKKIVTFTPIKTMGMIEKEIANGIKMKLEYYMVDEHKVRISSVKLHIENYEETLNMEKSQKAMTV